MSRMLKLLSLNVQGLRNGNKRRATFSYLKSQKVTIFCLQETYSSPEDKKLWSAKWGASIIYSHGTTHSKGVCILLNPSSPFNYFFITNIYGPNSFHDQDDFTNTLSQQLRSKTDTSKVIINGDWYITLNQIDKLGCLPWKATSGRNTLVDLMEELNLADVYGELHPKSKSFTYISKSLNLKSRSTTFLFRARIFAMLDKRKFVFRQRQTITRSS